MQLLLKSAQVTTNPFLPTYKPTDIQLSSLAVGEGQPAGTTVGVLSTTDVVTGDYTYSLVAGTGGQDNGSFAIVGNQLRTNAIFSLSAKSSYAIRVRTTDKNQQWYEEPFTITVLGAGIAPTQSYSLSDESAIKADWLLQGHWRVEGNGLRLLDINSSLTSKQTYNDSTQKVVFSYDITPNTQMWLSVWGETLAFEVPSSKVGSVVATVQRQGDTVTFDSGNGSSTIVKIKQANLATATPLVLKMDQRNLYRPTMELLLKSAQITTNPDLAVTFPSTPTAITGTTGNTQVRLSWTAPSSNGGAVITDYIVQYSSNAGSSWTTFSDGTSTTTAANVTGLTNGTGYIFRVAAVNSVGMGAYSARLSTVTPRTVSSAPSGLVGTAGNQQVSLSWTAPSSNGGAVITDYLIAYSSNNGASWIRYVDAVSATTFATVKGLVNGRRYVFKVSAVNSAGASFYSSPSSRLTPRAGAVIVAPTR
jgi:hypothetical protein